jgi:proteic killer suppression protein
MRILFASRKLKRQFSDEAALVKAFGERARGLMKRIDVLKAAKTLDDVPTTPPHRRHALSGKWAGHYAVDVTGNWRLIFRPASQGGPGGKASPDDPAAVTAIEIVAVVDYH